MSVTLEYDPARVAELRAFLDSGSFHYEARPHQHFLAKRPGVSVNAYHSGKLVIAGAQAHEYAAVLVARGLAKPPPGDVHEGPHAGSDESGKGDYFGPLVVAAVHIPDAKTTRELREKGARDSKRIPDDIIAPLASLVRARCPHRVVALMPPRYNELYAQIGNVNGLLAWAHARALEDLLADVGNVPIVVDQFARGALERRLMERGREAKLTIQPRAEADIAVAAASILARAEFLASIAHLSERAGMPLPLGAGAHVIQAARRLIAEEGEIALQQYAKVHFATTRQALGHDSA